MGSALDEETYLETMSQAGFVDVKIVDKHTFSADVVRAFLDADAQLTPEQRERADSLWSMVDQKVSSVRVYALKAE